MDKGIELFCLFFRMFTSRSGSNQQHSFKVSNSLQKEMEGFYGNAEPSPNERLSNIIAAARKRPQTLIKGLRMLRDTNGNSIGSEIFGFTEVRSTALHNVFFLDL